MIYPYWSSPDTINLERKISIENLKLFWWGLWEKVHVKFVKMVCKASTINNEHSE